MRIGIDATPLIGNPTGVGWYTAELARAMADRAPHDEFLLMPITWRRASLARHAIPEPPGNIRFVSRFAPARPLWSLWERVPFPPLESLLRCDVFHATNFLSPPAWRAAVVLTVHDLSFVRMPETCNPVVRRYADLLPPVMERADAIIAVSEFTRLEIADWQPSVSGKVRVVYPGPRSRQPVETSAIGGTPVILYLGDLGPRKNLTLLLDAYRILRARGVEARLVLAGGRNPLLDVDALTAGLPDVTITGYIDDAAASRLLGEATVFAWPSTYEGFGIPLLEAMGARLPVVAADAGPTPEVTGEAALLTAPDPDAFAGALARALGDEALRAGLIEKGLARASRFSWSRAAGQTLDIYRSIRS